MSEAEALARMCESKGQTEHAKEIRAKIDQAKMARSRRLKRVDFFHPTDEMIADGKKNGCVASTLFLCRRREELQLMHQLRR